jgi:hypothetical protein
MIPLTTDTRWRLGKTRLTQSPIEQMWAKYGKLNRPCSGCALCRRGRPETVCHCDKCGEIIRGDDAACGALVPKNRPAYQIEMALED